jgi:hypothetical protein
MKKKTSIVELVISDENEALTIDAISLVTSPAIEQDFVYFNKSKNNLTFAKVDEEKRELISPALIPNKQIFRYDPNTDSEYYVYFSKETVKKASHLYLKHNNHHKATEQHTDRVSGVLTVESWIKEGEQDKSNLYGFDLPIGTWFVKMKIENDEVWNKIKDGTLKGLSIEGYFTNKFEQMNKKEFTTEEVKTALKELLSVQKVELSVISEAENTWKAMQRLVNNGADDFKIANDEISEYTKALDVVQKKSRDLNTTYDILEKLRVELNSRLDEAFIYETAIEKQAKELGVNLKDISAYDNLTFYIGEAEDSIDVTMRMKDKIEKLIK